MTKNMCCVSLLVGILGCASPQVSSAPPSAPADTSAKEISQLKDLVARLEKRIGHLESEVSAASPDHELTAMTIDSVQWLDGSGLEPRENRENAVKNALLCHVVEWKDFGKMLRFTRKADPDFYLEAEGHPTVAAKMGEGGITGGDGRIRFVELLVFGSLVPNTSYRLVPFNKNDQYHWSVVANLGVVAPEAKR